ncbi:MAG TPA: response regulator [Ohtaekwangia sp.]|nr:response regulator [Ohtaekwangia sp.]
MSKKGPIIIVDDDSDDQELLASTFDSIGIQNKLIMFQSAEMALIYLYETKDQPFMIISDINMPIMNGIEFKMRIDQCEILTGKCIPFIFLSTCGKPSEEKACNLDIEGFFEKQNSLNALEHTLRTILNYWKLTRHIN